MKFRDGFVSNSSSSSFIVAFKKKPENVSEVKEVLFGSEEQLDYYDEKFTTWQIAQQVFDDIKEPLTEEQIAEELSYGYLDDKDAPEYSAFVKEDGRTDFDEYHKAKNKYAQKRAKKFLKIAKGRQIYKFHYSDNDSNFFSAMEHGEIFYKLPHIQISHH